MLQAFTRNYTDDSSDAGYQFTFHCDSCGDGYKTSFLESSTYKKKKGSRLIGQGANIAGNLLGGRLASLGWAAEHGSNVLSERFDDRSPEWHKEQEQAFIRAQNEAQQHFHRCPNCTHYVCDNCLNEDEGLCVQCAPRQEIYVARARAEAMRRNIEAAGENATVWQGKIESKTTVCPACGKPAGTGKFCNNCGANMELRECSYRAGDAILSPICRLTRTGPNISMEILFLADEEQEILDNYIEKLPLRELENRKKHETGITALQKPNELSVP